MTDAIEIQEQLIALQTQVAFQEDTIGQLNAALAIQQRDMALLKRQLELLSQQFTELSTGVAESGAAEVPPHY